MCWWRRGTSCLRFICSRDRRKYAVVIEHGQRNLSAYVPDLPGCVTTGGTVKEIERNMREAIALHLEGLIADGESIPEPRTSIGYVEV